MMDWMALVAASAAILTLVLVWKLLAKMGSGGGEDLLSARFEALERIVERLERSLREDLRAQSAQTSEEGRLMRKELADSFEGTARTLVQSVGGMGEAQRRELGTFSAQLVSLQDSVGLSGKQLREEVLAGLKGLGDSVLRQAGELAQLQKDQLDAFGQRLTAANQATEQRLDGMRQTLEDRLSSLQRDSSLRMEALRTSQTEAAQRGRDEIGLSLKNFNDSVVLSMGEMASVQKGQVEALQGELRQLADKTEQRLETMRSLVDARLAQIQADNAGKLEEMRRTVDERLQGTLEQRLGESFRQVSERLEQVHKGLGEMQNLAAGVGDLKRVLTNVKTRGTWGEYALGAILEQILTPEQYACNVATKPGSGERVEYAIRLPGREKEEACVWLPVDAKFPKEDYERLMTAADAADALGVADASGRLEKSIQSCARDIRDKYLDPPNTTDFAILFLPVEGLYAEVIRRPGLVDTLQRDFRIVVAGPTTLSALLNALQMGFRTLAIQKRSSEVWAVLGAVKTEFGKFGVCLDDVKKRLQRASDDIDKASVRSRAIERKLRTVQELPAGEATQTLLLEEIPAEEP